MSWLLYDATVFTPTQTLERQAVVIDDDGVIVYVGDMHAAPPVDGLRINLRGRILAPGFIDVHVHGGNGINFGDEDLLEGTRNYSQWVASTGVTGWLPSVSAPDAETLVGIIKGYVSILGRDMPGAEPLGLHLEGPFINVQKKGAFNPAWIHEGTMQEAQAYIDAGKGWVTQVTLAPELPNGQEIAGLLRRNGIVAAMGHTNTDYEFASQALRGNFTHVTHTFNAQSGFDHRAPGVFGAILGSDHVTAELIGDGYHVHPGAMKVLLRSLGTDRVVLITDAIMGTGLPEGEYHLVGHHVTVKDGRATLANGTLAGSVATMNACVRNVNKLVGYPLAEAVKMASLNPARAMGFAGRLGSVQPGKDASLTVIDEDVHVYMTIVKGKIVYNQL